MGFLATGAIGIGVHGDGSNVGIHGGPAFSWATRSLGGYPGTSTVNDTARFDSGDKDHNWRLNNVATDIGYVGNPLEYSHNDATGESKWEYLAQYGGLGVITVGFEVRISGSIDCSFNSNGNINVEIHKNGTLFQTFADVIKADAPTFGTAIDFGTKDLFVEVTNLNPGDTVSMFVKFHAFKSGLGFCNIKIIGTGDDIHVHPNSLSQGTETVRSYFKLSYIRRQLGSIIDWSEFDRFKEFKWLDLLRGVVDDFNLQFNTDTKTKTVTIEPTHNYSQTGSIATNSSPGFYNGDVVDWSQKKDVAGESVTEIFQDFERDVIMRMKDDGNDGLLKLLQDRTQSNMTGVKYLFPERFKKGGRDLANRFFSGVVHYQHDKFKLITGTSPQFIALIPENISNTSNPESESTFQPKLAYYKGMVNRKVYGGWNWDGDTNVDLPYMFAVNYKPGGEDDPILSYCDQRIGDAPGPYVVGVGLFRRYFLQRFAIMREGKKMSANFRLINSDVTGTIHREFKEVDRQRFQLLNIKSFKPMADVPCNCTFWKWHPITQVDADNTFPSLSSVVGTGTTSTDDINYAPLIALTTDIPT